MNKALLTFVLCAAGLLGRAQPFSYHHKTTPIASPDVSQLGVFIDNPISISSGTVGVNVPIYTFNHGGLTLPVSLNYHGGGIRVDQQATSVGLGWSLNAGGVISRTVKGLPDEYDNGNGTAPIPNPGTFNAYNNTSDKAYLLDVLNNRFDSQSDVFSFSFPGYTGHFIINGSEVVCIPKQDLKITYNSGTNALLSQTGSTHINRLKQFTIIDPNGIRYEFGTYQNTEAIDFYEGSATLDLVGPLKVASSWHLLRISTSDNLFHIQLNYTDENFYVDGYGGGQQKRVVNLTGNGVGNPHAGTNCSNDDATYGSTYSYYYTKKISQIQGGGYDMQFVYNTTREDLATWGGQAVRALTKIDLAVPGTTILCKSFHLSHDYFKTSPNSSNWQEKRLRLLSIQEKSCNEQVVIPAWLFGYTTDFIPSLHSTGKDFWGFYNGKEINDPKRMFPSHDPNGVNLDALFHFFLGANRSPDPQYVTVALLSEVQFPAGGSESFQYEINEYNTLGNQRLQQTKVLEFSASRDQNKMYNRYLMLDSVELETAKFKLTGFSSKDLCSYHKVLFINSKSDTVIHFELNAQSFEISKDLKEVLPELKPNVLYEVMLYSDSVLRMEIELPESAFTRHGPGVRIANRIIRNNPSSIVSVIDYTYLKDNLESSGQLGYLPDYYIDYGRSINVVRGGNPVCFDLVTYQRRFRFADSYIPLSSFDNRLMYYSEVTETYQGNGKVIYEYHLPTCCPSSNFPGVSYPSAEPPIQLIAGKIQKQTTFTENGALVRSKEYSWYSHYDFVKNNLLALIDQISYSYNGSSNNHPNTCDVACYTALDFFYTFSPVFTGVAVPTSVIEFDHGVSTSQTYVYPSGIGNSNIPLAPIKSETQNSDGSIKTVEYEYAINHPNSGIAQVFANLNRKAEVWREIVKLNNMTIGGTEKEYAYFNIINGGYSPTSSASFLRLFKMHTIYGHDVNLGYLKDLDFLIQSYRPNGLPAQVFKTGWLAEQFTYNSVGRIASVTYGNLTLNYQYHGNSELISQILNERSQPIWFDYDQLGRLQKKWVKPTAHFTAKSSAAVTESFVYTYAHNGIIGRNRIVKTVNSLTTPSGPKRGASDQTNEVVITYIDGLGRLMQTNKQALNPTQKDVVDYYNYDAFGRVVEAFKPIQSIHSDGRFVSNFSTGSVKKVFTYENGLGGELLSETDYNWYPSQMQYYSNSTPIHIQGINYQANTLKISQNIDANGLYKREFVDKFGRLLRVEFVRNTAAGEWAITDYVYNERDQIVKIVPPGASASDLNLVFQYEYDQRGRKVRQRVPGKDWEEFFYHPTRLDVVVAVKNHKLSGKGAWLVYKYDDYGNVIEEGECPINTFGLGGTALNPNINLVYAKRTFGSGQYNKNLLVNEERLILESSNASKLVFSYNYDSHGRKITESSNTSSDVMYNGTRALEYYYDWFDRLVGVTTVLTHHNSASLSHEAIKRFWYNVDGNLVEKQVGLNGQALVAVGYDYNYLNELVSMRLGKNGASQLQKLDFSYTHQGWLKSLNDNEMIPIEFSFNRLGENGSVIKLCPEINMGLTFGATSLVNGENDLFHYRLAYDTRSQTFGSGQQEKTGNIAQVSWQMKGRPTQYYNYHYDFLSRLTAAHYGEVLTMNKQGVPVYANVDLFNEELAYDLRGNITHLSRWGMVNNEELMCFEARKIDEMDYTYLPGTNLLKSINDVTQLQTGWGDFTGIGLLGSYSYNGDGDLIDDPYKAISQTYNTQGQVSGVSNTLTGGTMQLYALYGGNLVEKHIVENGIDLREFYVDDFVFVEENGGSLSFKEFYFEEGRIRQSDENFVTEYKIQDHLGNTRVVFADLDGNGSIEQNGFQNEVLYEEHYYPFGLSFGNVLWRTPEGESFKPNFNGKEKVTALNLQQLLFGARNYDPAVGRWWSVDPLADQFPSWTPYHFVHNNPINLIDPDGRAAMPPDDHYINNDGSIRTVKTDDNFDRFYVQDNTSETGYRLAGQLNKNDAGLVQFPASGTGYSRYGSSDAGGTSTSPAETVGQGDHYLQPETAAALYGLVNKLNTDFGFNLSLGDMSSSNGSDPWQRGFKHHAGHGHLGKRSGLDVDFRYLNSDGVSFQSSNAFENSSFSPLNNQRVYDAAATFGFTKNYQGTSGSLTGVTKVGGHNDHGHLGLQYRSLDWKYVPTAPTRQTNSGFNWLNR